MEEKEEEKMVLNSYSNHDLIDNPLIWLKSYSQSQRKFPLKSILINYPAKSDISS